MLQFFLLLASLIGQADAQVICCGGYNQSPPYTGQIATRSYLPDGNDATNRQLMSRSMHVARAAPASPITSLKIIVPNFNVDGNGQEVGQTGTGTLQSATVTAGLEYPLGTCTQIKFGGGATGTINTGVGQLISDSVTPPFAIPGGAMFAVRIYYVGSAGMQYNVQADSGYGDVANVGVSGIVDRTVTCSTIPSTAGANYMPPIAIIGTTQLPSVCLIGDSIGAANSFGTPIQQVATFGLFGPFTQAFSHFGWIDMSRGSTTAAEFASTNTNRTPLLQYCTNMVNEYGTNDLFAGSSVATLETNLATINANFVSHAASPKTVTMMTVVPRTTSTDNWATSVNQSLPAWEANRISFNNDVRSGSFYTGTYIDMDMAWGTGANFGLWKSPATVPGACSPYTTGGSFWTVDGIHPSTCGDLQAYLQGVVNPNWFHR